jgi:hypothetical protein
MKGVTVAPARLRGVLRDEGGESPWLLHVSGVYLLRDEEGSCTEALARLRGVLRDEGDHRGSSTSQGSTHR